MKVWDYQSLALQPKTLGCVEPLSERRHGAHRQQPYRAANSTLGSWKKKLAVRRITTQRSTCGGADELDPINGHDAYAYPKDVLTRPPTQRASEIGDLLPHRWQPA